MIEPGQVEYSTRTKAPSKRKWRLSQEELQEIAENKGIGDLHKSLVEGLEKSFDVKTSSLTTVTFIGVMAREGDLRERQYTILNVVPGESSSDQGVRFYVYIDRLLEYLGASRDEVLAVMPSGTEEYVAWRDAPPALAGFFKDTGEIDRFISGLNQLKK